MVDWRYRKPVDKFEPLKVLAFPFFLENILLIGLFSIMFSVACIWAWLPHNMGIRSVPLWLICITLFFNYAFVIVDYTSRGMQHIPKLSGDLIFPTHDARLYTIAGLTICCFAFVFGAWDTESQFARLVIAFFTYPLVFSLLVLNKQLVALLNPLHLLKSLVVFCSSMQSVGFFLLQLITGTVLYLEFKNFKEISPAHIFWEVPLSLILLFMLFRSLGVVLNTQGPKLGISVLQNEDTQQQALEEEARIQLDEFIMELHKWARVHEYKKAFALIEEFQKSNNHSLDDSLFHRLSQWDDKRLASMLGAGVAERILNEGDTARALKVFRESYDMKPTKFKFTSGTMALAFLKAATDQASRQRLFEYLQRFDSDFPNHPMTPNVFIKVAELAIDEFNEPQVARDILNKAVELKPDIKDTSDYARLKAAT